MLASDLNDILTQVSGLLTAFKASVTLHELDLIADDLIPLLSAPSGPEEAIGELELKDALGVAAMLTQVVTTGRALLTPRPDGTVLCDVIIRMIATVQARPLELAGIALFL
jgi:hypothetical protein